jgi:transcriptional regulator with XRE-family HTH domain
MQMKNPRKATEEDRQRGREIARLRKSKKMTQANLANALGISTQQYGKYERGTDRMAMSRYLKIVEILGRESDASGFDEKSPPDYQPPRDRAALRKDIDQIRAMLDRLQDFVDRAR